jgi:translocator protein
VPIGFAKTICVAILVAFLLFYVDALWTRRRRIRVYDKLVIPLALTSVLVSCWIVAFRQKEIALSVALIAAAVALAGVLFVRVASVSPSQHSGWLRVPFSLHFGAMTIALLVAVTQWLNASGLLTKTAMEPEDLASAFLAIAAVTGGFVALRYRDFVYPAVIASVAGATFIAQRTNNPHVAADALIVCVGMLVVVVLAAVALAKQPGRDPTGVASRRRAKIARKAQDEGWYLIDPSSSILRL